MDREQYVTYTRSWMRMTLSIPATSRAVASLQENSLRGNASSRTCVMPNVEQLESLFL